MACDLTVIDRHILGEVWTTDEMWRNLVHLCDDLGHRFGGSASEHAAAQFLLEKMRAYGLQNAHLEEFPVYTWDRGTCKLTVTEPHTDEITAIAMPYCGSGVWEGTLIDAGEGEQADYERLGDTVRGNIVLTDAETASRSHRTDKYRWAHEAGAAAVIFLNRNPGLLHITGALYAKNPGGPNDEDHEAPIPAIGITYESGALLRRKLERGEVKVRIELQNQTRLSHSYNVVGDIPGGSKANEIVLFGGHYDGHDIAQGAADDGAGTLVGLEVGRVLAPFAGQLDRTVRIICYGCEEIGLIGSWAHADTYAKEGNDEQLVFSMNLDGAGRGEGGRDIVNVSRDNVWADYFRKLGDEMGYQFQVDNRLGVHSDHFPYFLAGYPSATLRSLDATAGMIGRGYGHTEADTVDKVTPRGLQMGAAFAARVAARLACLDEFPSGRRDEAAVRQVLEEDNMLHVLEKHWGRDNRADI
ncbi:MAG TPA: M28 family peptidase [Thermomicrobiales bacterium]|nr:M28 family peptidase [Thermomicrobiales bacterium]